MAKSFSLPVLMSAAEYNILLYFYMLINPNA